MRQLNMPDGSSVANAFDILATRHNDGLNHDNLLQTSLYHAATWETIKQAIPFRKPCLVLDVGGGNGLWTIHLTKLGHKVVYVDYSKHMAQKAWGNLKNLNLPTYIVQGDARNLGFLPANHFDLILGVGDLICYVDDPLKVCKELYRCCKVGGNLVISAMGRYGLLSHLTMVTTVQEIENYLTNGLWVEFEQEELGKDNSEPLIARSYASSELADLCQLAGWQLDTFFGAGILRTFLGRQQLDFTIESKGMSTILDIEKHLARSCALLDCAMEFGLLCVK